jgi:hypothetical protein
VALRLLLVRAPTHPPPSPPSNANTQIRDERALLHLVGLSAKVGGPATARDLVARALSASGRRAVAEVRKVSNERVAVE